jgi:hypothetical protein
MRRLVLAGSLGLLLVATLVQPVAADTGPGPGPQFRDSGSTVYFNAFTSSCGTNSCTDTFVSGYRSQSKSGDSISQVCVEQVAYALRGGKPFSDTFGCADAPIQVAGDLSSASAGSVSIAVDTCTRRCTSGGNLTVSASLNAIASPVAYSYTQRSKFGTCTDTFRVKGSAADAEGTLTVGSTIYAASGNIGAETFAFSSRC